MILNIFLGVTIITLWTIALIYIIEEGYNELFNSNKTKRDTLSRL